MDLQTIQEDYQRDGVVRVRNFFGAEELRHIKLEITRYVRDIAPKLGPASVTFEADGVTARNLWGMEKHSAFFAEIARQPDILKLAGTLTRGEPILLAVETFNKPARIGSAVPPHQDNAYFCQSPADVLTIWIAMDPVTNANGPVYYELGSHGAGMLSHKPSGVKGNSMGLARPFKFSKPFAGLLDPGDALIHHCQTVHYSEPNHTDLPRCGFLLVYRGAHTQFDETLKDAYDSARSVMA